MPIRFRCSYCNRLLGIATRKAGTETICPHCGYSITVPVPQDDDSRTERINLDDVDQLLGNSATEVAPRPVAAVAPPTEEPRYAAPPAFAGAVDYLPAPAAAPEAPPPPVSRARPAPPPVPKKPAHTADDPPLFEGDVDAILGSPSAPEEPTRDKKPAPVSGLDAISLGEPAQSIVISAQKATMLMALVVVLMVLSFAAGYLVKG